MYNALIKLDFLEYIAIIYTLNFATQNCFKIVYGY